MSIGKPPRETRRAAALREIRKVVPLIDSIKREREGTDWSGKETCPICQRKIQIHHFREEGRTWGRCETKDCVAWMVIVVIAIIPASQLLASGL